MLIPKKYLQIFFIVPILAIPLASAYENTEISVSLQGDPIINLDDSIGFLRAYVDVTNFDPSDGDYYMHIIHSSTGETISEQAILVREKGNDKAGVDVAYLINEENLIINGTPILGQYDILITTESGTAIGKTTFSIIKPSQVDLSLNTNSAGNQTSLPQKNEDNSTGIQLTESEKLDPTPQIVKEETIALKTEPITNQENKIPEWIRTIFILYAEGSISDTELLNAIEFLIGQEIIIV